jgi:hypothetical protein
MLLCPLVLATTTATSSTPLFARFRQLDVQLLRSSAVSTAGLTVITSGVLGFASVWAGNKGWSLYGARCCNRLQPVAHNDVIRRAYAHLRNNLRTEPDGEGHFGS